LAQAFCNWEEDIVIVLGDNIFFGSNMDELLQSNKTLKGSCFAYHVSDPERYGVVEFDKDLNALSIEEKLEPKSNFAVGTVFFMIIQ
jgi:glucose-1-phosphate thymidylyltransferase